jgi:hypothetical protein
MQTKVSTLLGKINRLASQSTFPEISKLEYDLLLQHLRDLYQELTSLREDAPVTVQNQETPEMIQPVSVAPVKNEPVIIEVKQEAEPKTKPTQKSSINEVVRSGESLNSKVKSSSKEVHHKLSTKPMKELIDLNKRYVVVSELFKGDGEACAKAIHQIDVAENYTAAESYIRSTLFPAYNWNESSETVKLFLSLLKQKFGVE